MSGERSVAEVKKGRVLSGLSERVKKEIDVLKRVKRNLEKFHELVRIVRTPNTLLRDSDVNTFREIIKDLGELVVAYALEAEDLPYPLVHQMVRKQHEELLEVWVEKGLPVSLPDFRWRTPLHCAAKLGRSKEASVLLKNGADPLAKDWEERIPLHLAVMFGPHPKLIKLLLGHVQKESLNAQDIYGKTPLHYAAAVSRKTYEYLLKRGADPNIVDHEGRKPEDYFGSKGLVGRIIFAEGLADLAYSDYL